MTPEEKKEQREAATKAKADAKEAAAQKKREAEEVEKTQAKLATVKPVNPGEKP